MSTPKHGQYSIYTTIRTPTYEKLCAIATITNLNRREVYRRALDYAGNSREFWIIQKAALFYDDIVKGRLIEPSRITGQPNLPGSV